MKKFISMALTLIMTTTLTAGSSTALAEAQSTTAAANGGSTFNTKDFQEHKAKILEHISDRLAKIQAIQSCVQAANDPQALRACKPHRHKKHADNDHGN